MLKIKGNYIYENEQPFFWLGDTAWLLFEKLTLEEAYQYLENRKKLGFNVIQCVLVHTYKDGYSCAGKSPLKPEYWEEVKQVVSYAKELGLWMGILPAWGAMVKQDILNEQNIQSYASFLIKTFKEFDNIIWILGGDIRGDEYYGLYDTFGKLLKLGNPERLITFHPFGRTGSYQWFKDCSWLDFHMFQSGHRRYDQVQMNAWDDKVSKEDVFGEDNYKYVIKNKRVKPFKPCLDGEPSYEGILQGLHDNTQPYWQAKDVRRYAYWSVLEGACGFTYGNNAIMQFYRKGDSASYGVREEWKEALHMSGSQQMQYLKQLMESFDFTTGAARPDLVMDPKAKYEHISVFVGNSFILCYSYLGKAFSLNLQEFNGKYLCGYWMNPENGATTTIESFRIESQVEFHPLMRKEEENDWILVLTSMKEDM